ncbi:molecular chaperone DnaK [Planctomycetales bacterium]|nr:molecular chaperone DnaK [Planctomycetales bacterium]
MAKTSYFGIDLGTTYSAISFIDEMGQAAIVEHGWTQLVPSIVFFGSDGIVVGDAAREKGRNGGEEAQRVVSFAKRNMPMPQEGEDEFEVNGDKFSKIWEFDGKTYTPVDVSAEVLKKLAENAKAAGQATIEKVAITCPAFFDDFARRRTKAAAVKGLGLAEENIMILEEPVAAALNYALETGEDIKGKTFLVYDLGGGTFDITVLTVNENNAEQTEYRVICTEGNHYLGGGNWDEKIVDFFKEEFFTQTGMQYSIETADDVDEFHEADFLLRVDAERRKQELSDSNSVTQTVRFNGQRARVELTREKFDELTSGLLDETFQLTDRVIELAKENKVKHFDAFLLVGGSTFMRQVPEGLAKKYAGEPALSGIEPIYHDPNKAVAKGAAKRAQMASAQSVMGEITDGKSSPATPKQLEDGASKMGVSVTDFKKMIGSVVVNVCPESYGVMILKDRNAVEDNDKYQISNLVRKGETRPAIGTDIYYPTYDGQSGVFIEIWENSSMEELVPLSESRIRPQQAYGYHDFDSPMKQTDGIKCELEVNDEGLFDLYVTDMRNGKRCHVTLENEKKIR